MRIKALILFCYLIISYRYSFSQVKNFSKEYYSWGVWGTVSDNQNKVLKKNKRIHSLAIYNYNDTVFPNDFILQFHHLKHLFVGGKFKEKHSLLIDSTKLAHLKGLLELQISDFAITQFPSAITVIDSLIFLRIDFCNLEEVSNEVSKLKYLKYLGFAGNRLVNLPDSIRTLAKLKVIDLSNNNFKTFPKVLIGIPNIKEIFIDNRYGNTKEGYNQNEIDYNKNYNYLSRLSIKRSVKYIYIETRDCDETNFITQSFKNDIEATSMFNPFIKSPLKKLQMSTRTGKICLKFPYIF